MKSLHSPSVWSLIVVSLLSSSFLSCRDQRSKVLDRETGAQQMILKPVAANLYVLQSNEVDLFLSLEKKKLGFQLGIGRPDGANSVTIFVSPEDQRVTSIVISANGESFKGQIVDQNADGVAETRVLSDGNEEVLLDGTWVLRVNDGDQVYAVVNNEKVPIEFRVGRWFKKNSN